MFWGQIGKKDHQWWIVEGERAAEPGDMPLILWRCLSMIPDSGIILWLVNLMSSCWRIRSAIDSIAVFQYHTPTIQENIFENTDFEQAIQIFLQAQDFWLIPRLQEEQKICLWTVAKRTQSIQNTSSFSCTLLWSTTVTFKKQLTYKPTFKRHSIAITLPPKSL